MSAVPPPSGPSLSCKPGVIETDLPGELILLDPATQLMFSLNETGRFVWRALPGRNPGQVAAALTSVFAVPPEQAQADVRALLAELRAAGLVLGEDDGG